MRLYEPALDAAGIRCFVPTEAEQQEVMHGIRAGVKANRIDLARSLIAPVAQALARRHRLDAVVLACTELPLALREVPGVHLVDPAEVLAAALADRAFSMQASRGAAR